MKPERREIVYGRKTFYWGREPTSLAERTAQEFSYDLDGLRVLDIGAGEGRDAVFYAECGADVVAIDISPAGTRKTRRLAAERGVSVEAIRGDANLLPLAGAIDVVSSSGVVQFIHPSKRPDQFSQLKSITVPGGVHAIFTFVSHPEVPPAPDTTADQYRFDRDELQSYYEDWETIYSEELIFEDVSGGIPHEHAARIHIARAPS